MYRDLYDIWFLVSQWLTRDVRGDFVALTVDSQEPSGEWVNDENGPGSKVKQTYKAPV